MKKKVLPPKKSADIQQNDAMPTHPAEENCVDNVSDIHVPEEPAVATMQANNIIVQTTAIDQNRAVGRIPYQEGVTPTGGKSVTVPILTAPAPFAPQVALTYNSQAGNGVAGFGWNIAGISAITVANRSIRHDNETAPIDMVNQVNRGAFALDGVRLVRTARFSNFHYETAQGFIVVRRTVTHGNAITEFEALYPDGSRATFRNDDPNTAARYTYPLRWMVDRNGNRIDFEYESTGNMFFIRWIGYGGRTAETHPSEILFTYSGRVDFTPIYIAGTQVAQSRLLTSIVSRNDEQELRTYQLTHALTHGAVDGVNRLIQLDCSIETRWSLNPLTFQYPVSNQNGRFLPPVETRPASIAHPNTQNNNALPQQIRGKMIRNSFTDGLLSHRTFERYGRIRCTQYGEIWGSLYPADEPIFITPQLLPTSGGQANPSQTISTGEGFQLINAVDVDGDGVDEVVKVNFAGVTPGGRTLLEITTYQIRLATQPIVLRRFRAELWASDLVGDQRNPIPSSYYFGDFMGNGRTQLLVLYEARMSTLINLHTGEHTHSSLPFSFSPFESLARQLPFVYTFDVNGDGKTELCHVTQTGLQVYFFEAGAGLNRFSPLRTDSTVQRADFANRVTNDVERPLFGDLSGNGLLDIVLPPHISAANTWVCYFNTGTGFRRTTQQITNIAHEDDQVALIDINRNGRSDLVHIRGNQIRLHLNNERGVIQSAIGSTTNVLPRTMLLPANIVKCLNSSSLLSISNNLVLSHPFSRDQSSDNLMLSMTDSYGVMTKNEYRNMAERHNSHYRPPLTQTRAHPFASAIFPLQLLTSEIIQDNNENRLSHRTYTYHEAVMHRQGLGFCGFARMDTRDVIANRPFQEHRNPEMLGVVTRTVSPFEVGVFNWTENRDTQRRTTNPRLTSSETINVLTQVTTYHHYSSYDAFNNPERIEIRYGDNLAIGPFRTVINQTFFTPTAARYIVGQPLTKTVTNIHQGARWTNKEEITYDAYQRPISLTAFTGAGETANYRTGITRWEYDDNGNITSELSAPFNVTELIGNKYTYDPTGRYIASVENALMQTTRFSDYDRYGNAQTITDHKGHVTQRVFDGWVFGTVSNITYHDWSSEMVTKAWGGQGIYTEEYIFRGEHLSAFEDLGRNVITHYDSVGRVVRESNRRFNGNWQHVDYRYDNKGRLHQVSLPFRGTSPTSWNTYTYDHNDRPIQFTEASGRITTWNYDGLTTSETVNGITTIKTVDVTGRLISVSDSGGTIHYTLRPDGQPSAITAPGNVVTTFDYDEFGRQISINDPSAGEQTFNDVFTNAGELTRTVQDARGLIITSKFDRYGRITDIKRPSTEFDTRYDYNAHGLLESEISNNGTSTVFTYDEFDRPATIKESVDDRYLEKMFTYRNGNVSAISYGTQAGRIGFEEYRYAHGHNTEIRFNDTPIWRLTRENDLGQVENADVDAVQREYWYDRYGLLHGQMTTTISATSMFNVPQAVAYDFLLNGNLRFRFDFNQPLESFDYDHLNRLTHTPNGAISYANNGNITYKQGIGTMEYSHSERPYQITRFNSATENVPMHSQQVTYTSFQRPATITENGVTANFDYNASGERVRMSVTQGNTQLLARHYIGRQYEQDVQTNTERLYIGGDAYSAPAVRIKEGNGNWDTYYLLRDHLGSITHIINPNAPNTLAQELSYDAWGRLRDPATHVLYAPGSEPNLLLGRGFTGHEHLPWFGLINCNARLYDPAVGRFLSPDPFILDTTFSQDYNRYTYCRNNPLKYTDPDGEFVWLTAGLGFAFGFARHGISTGNWGKAFFMGLKTGVMWGFGHVGSDMSSWAFAGASAVTSFIPSPSIDVPIGNSGFSIGMGFGFGMGSGGLTWGKNVSGAFQSGDFGASIGRGWGTNQSSWSLGGSWRDYGLSYSWTRFGSSDVLGNPLGAQTVGAFSFRADQFSARIENDLFVLGPNQDRWRTSAVELGWGDFVIGKAVYTNDPRNQILPEGHCRVDPDGVNLRNRTNRGKWGAWRYGQVYAAPLWIGVRDGNSITRVGFSHPQVQDRTQNFVHRWVFFGRQHFFNRYDYFSGGRFFSSGFYNPFSLFRR